MTPTAYTRGPRLITQTVALNPATPNPIRYHADVPDTDFPGGEICRWGVK